MPERRDSQLTIRIPQRIRDSIDADARADDRSVSDVINHLLARQYRRAKKKRAGGREPDRARATHETPETTRKP